MNSDAQSTHFSDLIETSFIPDVLKQQILNQPNWNIGDPIDEDHTALLWIDIFSFSPLCNRLMTEPVSGVEKITNILNSHYDFALKVITESGGHPLFFAGDGMMSAWPTNLGNAADAVSKAVSCAGRILKERNTRDDLGELLSLHTAISFGPWAIAEMENLRGKKLLSYFGKVFNDLTIASKNRAPNELLITDGAISFLPDNLKKRSVEFQTSVLEEIPMMNEVVAPLNLEITTEAKNKIKNYAPLTISFPISRERLKWVAEIRPITSVFLRFPSVDLDTAESLSTMREISRLTKPIIAKYDGLLNLVWMDEKETNMLICFGPAPSAHIDNPERSVRLAFEINSLLNEKGFKNSIGVASGMAYCGLLGNDTLRQSTIIGDAVNLSARLAGKADGQVLCDNSIFNATRKVVEYDSPISMKVKGREGDFNFYSPKAITSDFGSSSFTQNAIGRDDEFDRLMKAFLKIMEGDSRTVIIEGESGIGKSKLVNDFNVQAPSGNHNTYKAVGDFLTKDTPFNIWGTIFSEILGLNHDDLEHDNTEVLEKLQKRYGNKSSLLNIPIHTSFPDTGEVMNLTSAQKILQTHKILLDLLEEACNEKPLVLIFDDAQFMDEVSWNLLSSASNQISNCLFILTFQNTKSLPFFDKDSLSNAESIVLSPLTSDQIKELIIVKLGVEEVDTEIVALVEKNAKGNPFFCHEFIASLDDQELLINDNGCCKLVPDTIINEISLPETIHSAVRRRLDKLDQGTQLSIKVGSVIGQKFGKKIIKNIYPIENERNSVYNYLDEAKHSGILNDAMVDSSMGFHFNNATTAQVAYEMTLADQRRQLHVKSAEWYEENFKENINPFFVRLAHHWEMAGDIIKASEYYEKESTRLLAAGYTKQAMDIGIKGVNLFNIDINPDPEITGQKIGETMGAIAQLMEGKTIDNLVDLPKLTDPKTERLIVMLTHIGPNVYVVGRLDLFALFSVLGLRITLENGNGEATGDVYSMYAIIHRGMTGDSKTAYEWSQLALKVDSAQGGKLQSRIAHVHGWFLNHWVKPLNTTFAVSQSGIDAGLKNNDVLFTCYNWSGYIVFMNAAGYHLDEVIKKGLEHYELNQNRVIHAAFHITLEIQLAKALKGMTLSNTSMTDERFDEQKDLAFILETDFVNQIGFYHVAKLKLHTHFGEWQEALNWGENIYPIYPAIAHQTVEIEFEMFSCISMLYVAKNSAADQQKELLEKADAAIEKCNGWAAVCAYNFAHKALLLEAIKEGLFGDSKKAEDKFKQALDSCAKTDYANDKALILEHQLRIQLNNKLERTALAPCLQAWEDIGADGKKKYIEILAV